MSAPVAFYKLLFKCICTCLVAAFLVAKSSYSQTSSKMTLFLWSYDLAPIVSAISDNHTGKSLSDYSGIVVDIIASLPDVSPDQIDVVVYSRSRVEAELYSGDVDLTILSKEWVEQPEKLLFTKSIYVHKEFLYATKEFAQLPLGALIEQKYICARRGYAYPALDKFFEAKTAIRIDGFDEESLFEMLMRGRCDFVVTNEYVGHAIVSRKNWSQEIHQLHTPLEEVNFTLAFHPKWVDFVKRLNQHIDELQKNGQLQGIIDKHMNAL